MSDTIKTIKFWISKLSIPFVFFFPALINIAISICSHQEVIFLIGNHICTMDSSVEPTLANCVITFLFSTLFYSFKNKKIITIPYALIIYIPSLLNAIVFLLLSSQLASDSITIAINSDIAESFYFIRDRINIKIMLTISIYLIMIFQLLSMKSKKQLNGITKYHLMSIVVLIISVLSFNLLPINTIVTTINTHLKTVKEFSSCYNHVPLDDITSKIINQKQTYVIVIGESVDRKHMSLYGYDKNTTPRFDSIKNELYAFENARSAFDTTGDSIKSMLRMQSPDCKNIINFLKDAGFKIFWFSNQGGFNFFDDQIETIARLSDVYKSLKKGTESIAEYSQIFDEQLLYNLKEALDDNSTDKKIIFLHLIGSHTPIDIRYTTEFDVFRLPSSYYDKFKATAVCFLIIASCILITF